LLSLGSACNYFGSAKEFVFERFPNNQIWNIKIGENKNWYSNIRKGRIPI
jgi:hypothetical protein